MSNAESPKYILAPAFMGEFACTDDCERSCCHSPCVVYIDKAAFARYHALPDSDPMKLRVQRSIKRLPPERGASDRRYAEIRQPEKLDHCPFLGDDGRCDIERSCGADMLCNVCATYPRVAYMADRQLYMSCVPACPEVARLALLEREGMEFAYFQVPDEPVNYETLFTRASRVYTDGYGQYYKELQFFLITLLQNRDYALWERLTIYGMFLKKLESTLYEDTLRVIAQYNDYINSGAAHEPLDDIPTNPAFEMYISTLAAARKLYSDSARDARIKQLFTRAFNAMSLSPELDDEKRVENYRKAYDMHFVGWMKENGYILENLLVLEFFSAPAQYLVFDRRTSFAAFRRLALFYGVVRFVLTGLCAEGELSPEAAVDALSLVSRYFAPSQAAAGRAETPNITEALANKSMGFFASMLRE